MITAVDTNIILDILKGDSLFFEKSKSLLEEYNQKGMLFICPLVYSELLLFFIKKHTTQQDAIKALEQFLFDFNIHITDFSKEDAYVAAEAWGKFIERNKRGVSCPFCGSENKFFCGTCKKECAWRNHLITDFFIGAHAQNRAEAFLTRDRGFYKKYFKVKTIF